MNKTFGVGSMLFLAAMFLVGCGGETETPTTPAAQTPASSPQASPSPRTQFEQDLQFIRNGSYTYIWVFSRKDGKPLDKDDAAFLRKTAPQVVDWVTTDEGKKVIGGTNFNLEEGNLEVLKKRFVTEDYSNR
jgi:hypothetical protein